MVSERIVNSITYQYIAQSTEYARTEKLSSPHVYDVRVRVIISFITQRATYLYEAS